MEEQIVDYKEFRDRLKLRDDKISLLLYDLYKYKLNEDTQEKRETKELK